MFKLSLMNEIFMMNESLKLNVAFVHISFYFFNSHNVERRTTGR